MGPMRPPDPFLKSHRLSDWVGCTLELRCRCGRSVMPGILMILDRYGDMPFTTLLPRLRCKACGNDGFHRKWLVAGHHRDCFAGPTSCDWAVIVTGKGEDLDEQIRQAQGGGRRGMITG